MRVKRQGRKTAATMPKLFHTRMNFLPTQVKACVRQGVRVPVGVRVYVPVCVCMRVTVSHVRPENSLFAANLRD